MKIWYFLTVMRKFFFHLSPLAAAYFSLLLFLGNGEKGKAVITAVFVHEASHLLSLMAFHCQISSVKLRLDGLCIEYSGNGGTREAVFSNMAGPVGGFLFFLFGKLFQDSFLPPWLSMSCRLSLFLSLFNSMPVYPLDGGAAVKKLLEAHLAQEETEKFLKSTGTGFSVLLLLAGLVCLMKNSGFGLTAAGIWILCANISGNDL